MKKYIFLAGLVTLFITSCIPSLHPIFTEKSRITDDRLIGLWSDSENLIISNLNISKKMDSVFENQELKESIEKGFDKKLLENPELEIKFDSLFLITKELLSSDKFKDKMITAATLKIKEMNIDNFWNFERAENLAFSKMDIDGHEKVQELESWDFRKIKRLSKEGFELKSKELLPFYILKAKENRFMEDGTVEDNLIANLTEINNEYYLDLQPIPTETGLLFTASRILGHTFCKIKFVDDRMEVAHVDVEYLQKIIKSKRIRLKHEIIDDEIVLTASTEELRAFIHKYGSDDKLFTDPSILKSI